jgi:hypothetical protein
MRPIAIAAFYSGYVRRVRGTRPAASRYSSADGRHCGLCDDRGRDRANNIKVRELAREEGSKVAQNVAARVAGVFIPVLWFGMDFKGAASKESGRAASASAVSHDIGEGRV